MLRDRGTEAEGAKDSRKWRIGRPSARPPLVHAQTKTSSRPLTASLAVALLVILTASGCGAGSVPRIRIHRGSGTTQPSSALLTTTVVITTVGTVPLARASHSVYEQCRETAASVGYAIPCPELLPVGIEATEPVHGCQFRIIAPVGWSGCSGVRPDGWVFGSVDVGGRGGGAPRFQHLVLFGAPRVIRNPARAVDGPAVYPQRVLPRGEVFISRLRMTFYSVPPDNPSAFRDHLVLLWSERGHTYVYGFHVTGTVQEARALDLELVRHLRLVMP